MVSGGIFLNNRKKILITGSSGLIGKNLVNIIRNISHMEYELLLPRSKELDLRDIEQIERYFSIHKPTLVIHLAANVGGLYHNLQNNLLMYEENTIMNSNILKICHKTNINRCIMCLSTCIFPDEIDLPMKEEDLHKGEPHYSNYGYAHAKRQLDILCELYRRMGRDYCCIIPTNIYGKYDNFSLTKGHVIPMLIHKFLIAKQKQIPVIIWGNGSALRQFIYAEDLAKIIWRMITDNRPLPKRLILSTNIEDEISIKDVVKEISKICDYKNIIYDETKSNGQYRKSVSNNKLLELYDNIVFTSLKRGLKDTIRWVIENYKKEGFRK